jgi:transketolase
MIHRKVLANAIRFLSVDAVEKANSGHPGMPMGMADMAEVLWNDFLNHNPMNARWFNRDRFVLSNGHGSMLLYSLLHLTGYPDMSLDEIKNFRQLHSKTPGHPEYGITPGVEITTGPLGQGIAGAVGMALAEKILAKHFNRPDFPIVDHYTYVFLGDGCMMEGISHESASFAGHLKLGKLIAFWDDNGISIDGEVKNWFTDNTAQRFESYGWHVISSVDGHDAQAIHQAIKEAQTVADKPTLICCKTIIGYGAPTVQGTCHSHGSPLGKNETDLARQRLQWSYPPFEIPQEIYQAFDAKEKGQAKENDWLELYRAYQERYPQLSHEFERRMNGDLPEHTRDLFNTLIQSFNEKKEGLSTRKASWQCLNLLGPKIPELLGGSADLSGSNLTQWNGVKVVTPEEPDGQYIFYGVREFAMAAAMNGLVLHGGFIPFGGTFLTFSDYCRNAIRLSALMKKQVIYVFTHDSIGLGEDGPTHQPIEHAAMLRLTPNVSVWRPCDGVETAIAWKMALQKKDGPTALLLSRQNLPAQEHNLPEIKNMERGGYILKDCQGLPDVILIATGSEVQLAVKAWDYFHTQETHIKVRVISMPCVDVFDKQEQSYKDAILPQAVRKRIAIEAASQDYWFRFVGLDGKIIGLNSFGESAPAETLFKYFGFTETHVIESVKKLLSTSGEKS